MSYSFLYLQPVMSLHYDNNPMQTEPESIKTAISDYLFKYLDEFKINLEKAIEEYDAEAIHQYRVSVKRIRAITRALDKVYQEPFFPKKIIQPLRKMFKAGGTIRDDQVQIGLVENVEKEFALCFPLIKDFYQKRIDNQRNAFFLTSIDFDFNIIDDIHQQITGILEPLDGEYIEYNLYQRLHKSMEKLKRKRYDLDQPDKLHRFRTSFKENGYMFYHSKYNNKIAKSTYNRMKNFGQELGNWHDHYQLWSKTALIFQESRNIDLLQECLELRKLITPVHDKLFQEILHLIKRDDTLFAI
jgi:CHAD domain-containing protein